MFDLNPENLVSPSRLAILTRELMVVILDGSTEHDAHILSKSGFFDLSKAFDYIRRFFSEKTYFT